MHFTDIKSAYFHFDWPIPMTSQSMGASVIYTLYLERELVGEKALVFLEYLAHSLFNREHIFSQDVYLFLRFLKSTCF